ncbi:MAG: molybdopterin synthase catalytic subunit MoaE [Neptuniibacter sp.]
MPVTEVIVQEEDFDIGKLTEQVRCHDGSCGAVVTFTGIVRELEQSDSSLTSLFLEHYPGMTEKALNKIIEKARAKWPLGNTVVYHRVGELNLNDNIVFVGVASAHRVAAFEAAQFIMDYLKRDAPFWKKEVTPSGESWVEQKQSDLDSAEKWSN